MVEADEVIAAVELHLLNEWHLRNAKERRRERARRQLVVDRSWSAVRERSLVAGCAEQSATEPEDAPQPNLMLCYVMVSAALTVLAMILAVWG